MFGFLNTKERNRIKQISNEPYGIRWICNKAVEKGSSPAAANLIATSYEKGKISETEAIDLCQSLQYANDLQDLQERFRVGENPEEKEKKNADGVYGAIIGDLAGSRFEGMARSIKNKEEIWHEWEEMAFPTDDTILTIATERVLQEGIKPVFHTRKLRLDDISRTSMFPIKVNPFTYDYRSMVRKYPDAGYGDHFQMWAMSDDDNPYGSLGNGSAMRVSPVGMFFEREEDAILYAAISAMSTHNHIEGVKGAIVTAMCVWMARNGYSKEQIFRYMKKHYLYGEKIFEDFTYEEAQRIRFNQVECSYSVPASVIAFCESSGFVDAIEKGVMVGMDTDTNACICGGIAGAYYGTDSGLKRVAAERTQYL